MRNCNLKSNRLLPARARGGASYRRTQAAINRWIAFRNETRSSEAGRRQISIFMFGLRITVKVGCIMTSPETRLDKACFSIKAPGYLRSGMSPRINLLQRCCGMFAAVIAASVATHYRPSAIREIR